MTKRQRKAKRQPRPLTRRQKIRKLTARLAQIEPVFKEAFASRMSEEWTGLFELIYSAADPNAAPKSVRVNDDAWMHTPSGICVLHPDGPMNISGMLGGERLKFFLIEPAPWIKIAPADGVVQVLV